jgi:hypothetical protein
MQKVVTGFLQNHATKQKASANRRRRLMAICARRGGDHISRRGAISKRPPGR